MLSSGMENRIEGGWVECDFHGSRLVWINPETRNIGELQVRQFGNRVCHGQQCVSANRYFLVLFCILDL